MATVRAPLTPATDRMPAVVSVAAGELSGARWVARYPGSSDITELVEPFRSNVNSFLAAISAAGGTVSVASTYRPPERAYLMHYSSMLSRKEITAAGIPKMIGVDIEWVHSTTAASISAATAMARGYNIVFPPALNSNHTQRTAIDMFIGAIIGKTVKNALGVDVSVVRLADLNSVGETFGVNKLLSDPPHWSIDGR
jgi:hypothetical protein